MTVTRLQELTKHRVRVYLDGEAAFILYQGELNSFGIRENEPLSDASYTEITQTLLPKRATLRAMNLLKARPYTVKGLTEKLTEGEYPESAIESALSYVSGYGYLNDKQYALDFINTYKERKNRVRLKQDLLQKGIRKELIEEALSEELQGEDTDYEREQIERFLQKKHFDAALTTCEEREKLLAALYRKGYSVALCREIMAAD